MRKINPDNLPLFENPVPIKSRKKEDKKGFILFCDQIKIVVGSHAQAIATEVMRVAPEKYRKRDKQLKEWARKILENYSQSVYKLSRWEGEKKEAENNQLKLYP